jgi:uncharacterized ferritin-like protein (DUF455 family)
VILSPAPFNSAGGVAADTTPKCDEGGWFGWWSLFSERTGALRCCTTSIMTLDSAPDIETWAEAYISTTDLTRKLAPPAPPADFRAIAPLPHRITRPGRPPELRTARRGERTPKQEALEQPYYRARTLHAFLHHELQAAELMCWAILAFPDAERDFRRGLLAICMDELRHLQLYAEHIRSLGSQVGDFGVRDWFWKRVPSCRNKLEFVAVMGMGLEAANLEYAPHFAARFRAAGDEPGARIQERIAAEEVAHVGFATRWFTRWTGGCDFEAWAAQLPAPLSPWVMHGRPIAHEARRRAGMSEEFLAALRAYVPAPKGRSVPQAEPA